jgi:hypothetical protein
MITQFHKKELKESFTEQTRFSKKLLELEEDPDSESDTESITDNEGGLHSEGCDCKTTEMTILEVDEIKPDITKKVQFVDDVQMNRAEISGTLTINETPFATFDATSNKLIIG